MLLRWLTMQKCPRGEFGRGACPQTRAGPAASEAILDQGIRAVATPSSSGKIAKAASSPDILGAKRSLPHVDRSVSDSVQPGSVGGFVFFLMLAVIVLTRSVFQLVWPLTVCAFLVVGVKVPWRAAMVAAMVPLMLIVGLQFWNHYRFGVFLTSSWVGMNLSRNTVRRLFSQTSRVGP